MLSIYRFKDIFIIFHLQYAPFNLSHGIVLPLLLLSVLNEFWHLFLHLKKRWRQYKQDRSLPTKDQSMKNWKQFLDLFLGIWVVQVTDWTFSWMSRKWETEYNPPPAGRASHPFPELCFLFLLILLHLLPSCCLFCWGIENKVILFNCFNTENIGLLMFIWVEYIWIYLLYHWLLLTKNNFHYVDMIWFWI